MALLVCLFEPIRVPATPALRRWCAEHGFSEELVARWGEFYPDLQGLLAAMSRPSATFLRLNRLRGPPRETMSRLEAKGFRLARTEIPGAMRIDEAPMSPGATHEYLQGRYFLHDVSSQLAPLALAPEPGDRVADLCAAPGGKTVAIADMMENSGAIAAFESNPERHRSLTANLSRCGVLNTATWARPGQTASRLQEQFDRVLLDAPCTGEGVVSRDPARRRGQLREYQACAQEQAQLFDVAARILRPGGILVYGTCTLAPEENELQVNRAVQELGFRIDDLPAVVRELRLGGHPLMPGLAAVAGRGLHPDMTKTAHALPHRNGCLGFYVARLERVPA